MKRRAAALVLALTLGGCGSAAAPPAPRTPARATHPAATPRPVPRIHGRYLLARLTRPARLRAVPRGPAIHRLSPRTEFGSPTILGVVGRRAGWLRVLTPALPNHRSGWIPAADARLDGTDYAIEVDRSARRATLVHGERRVLRFAVAVGRPGNETPLGRYAVTDKLTTGDRSSPYGCCALALTGHQTRLEPGWPGGDRLAIHGTPATWSIGEAASLGCLRAPERALRRLLRSVPLGAPVIIRA